MSISKRELRSWRERIATPLKGSGEEIQTSEASTNQTNPQTPESLRVGKWTGSSTNRPQTSEEPWLVVVGPNQWVLTPYALARCCFCPELLAEGDTTACVEHRRRLDETLMPWEGRV